MGGPGAEYSGERSRQAEPIPSVGAQRPGVLSIPRMGPEDTRPAAGPQWRRVLGATPPARLCPRSGAGREERDNRSEGDLSLGG